MKKLFDEVNCILAKWNPLTVDEHLVNDEYKAYIPRIISNINSTESLKNCLEDILINQLGVEYDPSNLIHLKDLEKVMVELQKLPLTSGKM